MLVVEHKPEMIAIADHVVDLGPGAGTAGGEVVFEGTVDGLREERHAHRAASLRSRVAEVVGAKAVGRDEGARRPHAQSART